MHSTVLRKQHIQGFLTGVAIGDALGFAREGLSRRVALKMFGRPHLKYRLLPGRGIYSDDTQLVFMAAQAMVQCRSELRMFRRIYQARLAWYLLSLPAGIGRATAIAAMKSWFVSIGLSNTGVHSAGNGSATRAMFCALALHNNGHRLTKWIDEGTRITHKHRLAIDGCQLLGLLTEIAATTPAAKLEVSNVLGRLIEASKEPEFRNGLQHLTPMLAAGRSPSAVARHFGWERGISGFILPSTIMAIYCWLRYPQNFRRAVESAICLGGDADSVGAIVGGLAGAHLGIKGIPPELIKQLAGYPQGNAWIEGMASRLADWPHGMHDISMAPPQPSEPLMQLVRNSFALVLILLHLGLRLPYVLLTRRSSVRTKHKRAAACTAKK